MNDFYPDQDAEKIKRAFTDADTKIITDILTKRTYKQRKEIATRYKEKAEEEKPFFFTGLFMSFYPEDIVTDIQKKMQCKSLKGVLLGLMKSTAEFDASEIKAAFEGRDIDSLIEILYFRNNDEMTNIKEAYKNLFKKKLLDDLKKYTSVNVFNLLTALIEANTYPSRRKDIRSADDDARKLYDAWRKKDVDSWIDIMANRSVSHLQQVFGYYGNYSQNNLEEDIRKVFKGDLEKSFWTLVLYIQNTPLYFVNRLEKALASKEVNEKVLTRIMVSQCDKFEVQFKKSLYNTIKEKTKGDYQLALLNLCG